MPLFKVLQKGMYDLLSSKQSLLFCFFGLVLLSISAFHFGEIIIEWSHDRYQSIIISYKDNLLERSLHSKLCQYLPIDAVYTWVNGSDPELISNLYKINKDHLKNVNVTRKDSRTHCTFSHCVSSYFTIMMPETLNSVDRCLNLKDFEPFNVTGIFCPKYFLGNRTAILRFDSVENAKNAAHKGTITLNEKMYTVREAFITDKRTSSNDLLLQDTYLMTGVTRGIKEENIREALPHQIAQIFMDEDKSLAMFTLSDVVKDLNLTSLNVLINKEKTSIAPAYLVAQPFAENEDASSNRYADNEELRYSLRSLVKHAPWIRKIFLVTNGQIPYWLNLDHPRIKVITHEEIFLNKSHLPTFSSPAIESHLHRISGLSKRFIYLNDDVFFGSAVLPEDFYTEAKGQKVYLSWPVPDCVDGCPTTWIKDGYCDRPCNNSLCDWDGGDCAGENVKYSHAQLPIFKPQSSLIMENLNKMYCNPSCTNSWLGDRYCDHACNIVDCGFDAGDCGVDNYKQMYGINLSSQNNSYNLPQGVAVAYFNLTFFSKDFGVIQSGIYEDVPGVRSVAISIKFQVLTMVLQSNFTALNVTLIVKSPKNEFRFIVTAETQIETTESPQTRVQLSDFFDDVGKSTIAPDKRAPKLINLDVEVVHDNITVLNHPAEENGANKLNTSILELEKYFESGYLTELGLKVRKAQLLKSFFLFEKTNSGGNNEPYTLRRLHSTEKFQNSLQFQKGFLPWENDKDLANFENIKNEKTNQYTLKSHFTRKLKDTFGDSLRHVNRLYNSWYGYEARKVPAHIAHFIDVDVMNRLHNQFPNEFDVTSSHKIRSPTDMQFAFSYYYFLTSETRNRSVEEIFNIFDIDNSGSWSDREIRTLLTRIYELPLQYSSVTNFENAILNCSRFLPGINFNSSSRTERYIDSKLPTITTSLVQNCEPIVNALLGSFGIVKRNKYEVIGEDEVSFKMLYSNISLVLPHLDELRKKPKKFICLNDNIGHGTNDAELIRAVLKDFLESFFPIPSPFELPPEYRNRYLHNDELRKWQSYKDNLRILSYIIIIALLSISVICFYAPNCFNNCPRRKPDKKRYTFKNFYTDV